MKKILIGAYLRLTVSAELPESRMGIGLSGFTHVKPRSIPGLQRLHCLGNVREVPIRQSDH